MALITLNRRSYAFLLLGIVLCNLLLLAFMINPAEAGKKKKMIKKLKKMLPLLLALKSKKKIFVLPLPLPIPMKSGGDPWPSMQMDPWSMGGGLGGGSGGGDSWGGSSMGGGSGGGWA